MVIPKKLERPRQSHWLYCNNDHTSILYKTGYLRQFPISCNLVACLETAGGTRHLAKFGMKTLRYGSDVSSGEIARHLLINFFNYIDVQPEISAHIRAPCTLFCSRTSSMNGFIDDCSRYFSYFHVIHQSGNALQSNQSEKVFNLLKRPPNDLHHSSQKQVSLLTKAIYICKQELLELFNTLRSLGSHNNT